MIPPSGEVAKQTPASQAPSSVSVYSTIGSMPMISLRLIAPFLEQIKSVQYTDPSRHELKLQLAGVTKFNKTYNGNIGCRDKG